MREHFRGEIGQSASQRREYRSPLPRDSTRFARLALVLAVVSAPRLVSALDEAVSSDARSSASASVSYAPVELEGAPPPRGGNGRRQAYRPNGWLIAAGAMFGTSYLYQVSVSVLLFAINSDLRSTAGGAAINLIPLFGPITLSAGAASSSSPGSAFPFAFGLFLAPPVILLSTGLVFLGVGVAQRRSAAPSPHAGRGPRWTPAVLPTAHGAVATMAIDWTW